MHGIICIAIGGYLAFQSKHKTEFDPKGAKVLDYNYMREDRTERLSSYPKIAIIMKSLYLCWFVFYFISGAVTQSKRFGLSVQFLTSIDRSAGSQLIEKLLSSLPDRQQDLAELGITEYVIQSIASKLSIITRHTEKGPVTVNRL